MTKRVTKGVKGKRGIRKRTTKRMKRMRKGEMEELRDAFVVMIVSETLSKTSQKNEMRETS